MQPDPAAVDVRPFEGSQLPVEGDVSVVLSRSIEVGRTGEARSGHTEREG
jgi:hypothetical protein